MEFPERYRTPLRQTDFAALIDEIRYLIGEAAVRGPGLLQRARKTVADGYPTSTRGGGGGGASEHTSVEAAVLVRLEHTDALRDLAGEMCQALLVARDAAKLAVNAWERSMPADKPCWKCGSARTAGDHPCSCGAPASEPGAAGCVVHARYEIYEPARARGRCRWCNDWAREHDFEDPSESEIRAREEKPSGARSGPVRRAA